MISREGESVGLWVSRFSRTGCAAPAWIDQLFLDVHTTEHGYTECRVPYLVTPDSTIATGQLPKFADESYCSERDDLWLVPTAEVPVTNLHRDELLTTEDLPKRYTATHRALGARQEPTRTRGLLRVHQFDKVELVRYGLG